MYKLSQPSLSVVISARNDNRGGNMSHRMQVFVDGLFTLSKKSDLFLELIVVEWNPVPDAKKLVDILNWSSLGRNGIVRVIEVPEQLHLKLPLADKMVFFQFVAKNVGIRRAQGEFVLCTNLDIIFSSPLINYLASQPLSKDCFYRIDRYDVSPEVPFDISVDDQLKFCEERVVRIHSLEGTFNRSLPFLRMVNLKDQFSCVLKMVFKKLDKRKQNRIHTVACGDFTLMSKKSWHALKGYPEIPSHAYVDGLLCNMAATSGLRQVVLEDPMRIYHQDHEKMFLGETSERPIMDYQQYKVFCSYMKQTGNIINFNKEDWGFGNEFLSEKGIQC